MKNVYLDINGVLLTNSLRPADFQQEFLEFITQNFNVYWLTTLIKDGDPQRALDFLEMVEDEKAMEMLRKITPTSWKNSKTEAIDFSTPFYWFDDRIQEKDRQILKEKNCEHSIILVNLNENPHQLLNFTQLPVN